MNYHAILTKYTFAKHVKVLLFIAISYQYRRIMQFLCIFEYVILVC